MCGIVGVLSTQMVDPAQLESALESMNSRGPDERGRWWSPDQTVGLGHCRLVINDPEGGRQPMLSGPKARYITVVNGEFYGGSSERCDSFLLPQAFAKFSPIEAIRSLRGEFAFLHYDQKLKLLTLARDRFGVKPLFWSQKGKELWFASKASALWAAGVRPDWCDEGFWRAASTQYPPLKSSLFRDIQSLPPAHWASLRAGESLKSSRYWQIPPQASDGRVSPQEFQQQLKEAVELRVHPSQTTAVQLSGGIDSAAVLALAKGRGHLHAFTVDFSGGASSFSEARRASETVQFLKIPHTVVELNPEQIVQSLGEAARSTEGLMVNGHGVAKVLLNRTIRKAGIKVCLSGEGSDELLYGYRHFREQLGQHRPDPLKDPAGLGILTSSGKYTLSPFVCQRLGKNPNFLHSKIALGRRITSLLAPDFLARFGNREAFEETLLDEEPNSTNPIEATRQLWTQTALRSYILETLGDGAEMSHSVEGRPPFLDHKLWEMMAAHSLDNTRGDKALLRKALGSSLPGSVREAPKHPFMAPPLGEPLLNALRMMARSRPHPYVEAARLESRIGQISALPLVERWEWEPALCWLLSSYHLQELWCRS